MTVPIFDINIVGNVIDHSTQQLAVLGKSTFSLFLVCDVFGRTIEAYESLFRGAPFHLPLNMNPASLATFGNDSIVARCSVPFNRLLDMLLNGLNIIRVVEGVVCPGLIPCESR